MVSVGTGPMLGAQVARGRPLPAMSPAPMLGGGVGGQLSPGVPGGSPLQQQLAFGGLNSPTRTASKARNSSYTPKPGAPSSASTLSATLPGTSRATGSFSGPEGGFGASGRNLSTWTPSTAATPLPGQGLVTAPASFLGGDSGPRHQSVPPRPQQAEQEKKYGQGVEVEIGEHRFRCLSVLGRGSYSEVWRAEVLGGAPGLREVALKEVHCTNQVELQQAIFEVQVLLALERSVTPGQKLRVPRCIAYKVEPKGGGWKVRTGMTVVPGESLDFFIRHPPPRSRSRSAALHRGCALAAKLIRDVGPMLQLLGPIAWHRDVNSHNILIDDAPDELPNDGIAQQTTFWLIDFGLAVDSQSWVTANGKWRTEYIGGDSRYWPPSSWIMHLLGPEGFTGRQDLCEQYQRRLDIHGLGITALELLCTIGLSCPASQEEQERGSGPAWEAVLEAWRRYRDNVWRWWSAVYQAFSTGGDIAPVQAQLVQDRIIEQLLVLLANIRRSLQTCAAQLQGDGKEARLLQTIADMLDEGLSFELSEVYDMLGEAPVPVTASQSQNQVHAAPLVQQQASAVARVRSPQAMSPPRPASLQLGRSAASLPPTPLAARQGPQMTAVLRGGSPVRLQLSGGGLAVGQVPTVTSPSASTGSELRRSLTASQRLAGLPAAGEQVCPPGRQGSLVALSPERVRIRDASLERPSTPTRVQTPQVLPPQAQMAVVQPLPLQTQPAGQLSASQTPWAGVILPATMSTTEQQRQAIAPDGMPSAQAMVCRSPRGSTSMGGGAPVGTAEAPLMVPQLPAAAMMSPRNGVGYQSLSQLPVQRQAQRASSPPRPEIATSPVVSVPVALCRSPRGSISSPSNVATAVAAAALPAARSPTHSGSGGGPASDLAAGISGTPVRRSDGCAADQHLELSGRPAGCDQRAERRWRWRRRPASAVNGANAADVPASAGAPCRWR